MKTVNVTDAKANLSALLTEVEKRGKCIVIRRNGKPVADLVPHRRLVSMKPDRKLGRIKIKSDPVEGASRDEWPEPADWSPRFQKAIRRPRPELTEAVDAMMDAIRSRRTRKRAPRL